MDNPIVDTIRDYNTIYNAQLSKSSIIENTIEENRDIYFNAFAPVIDAEESDRIGQIFLNADELLDTLFGKLAEANMVFDEFNALNRDYNEVITQTLDVSEYGDKFQILCDQMKDNTDKVNALYESCENYANIVEETINTLKAKYPDEYAQYLASLKEEENAPLTDEQQKNVEDATKIFDELNARRPEAMFVENGITAAFHNATETLSVVTQDEMKAYTEAIVVCTNMRDSMYQRFKLLSMNYAGADILNNNMGSVNNIINECNQLIKIFSNAVNTPFDYGASQSAQTSVYRYEALQNDYKIISEALNIAEQKCKDGDYRKVGGRSVKTEIDYDSIPECAELNALVGNLSEDIEMYFDTCVCDENLRAWIVNRYDDLIYHFENYKNILSEISATTSVNGGNWTLGIYGNEGYYGSLLGNELRECNLIAQEIRNVVSKPRVRY